MITAKKLRRVLGVVLVTASLVACGGDESSGPKAGVHDKGGADAFNASLVAENVIADVTVDPARVGTVLIHMEFAPPGGKLEKIASVTGNLIPPDGSLSTIILWFEASGTNHFHYEVAVPAPGEWTLEFDATLPDGSAALYTTKVTFGS
ncbi:MAG: hypothetical protein ACKODN_06845 [Actinomycetota bacterium]